MSKSSLGWSRNEGQGWWEQNKESSKSIRHSSIHSSTWWCCCCSCSYCQCCCCCCCSVSVAASLHRVPCHQFHWTLLIKWTNQCVTLERLHGCIWQVTWQTHFLASSSTRSLSFMISTEESIRIDNKRKRPIKISGNTRLFLEYFFEKIIY